MGILQGNLAAYHLFIILLAKSLLVLCIGHSCHTVTFVPLFQIFQPYYFWLLEGASLSLHFISQESSLKGFLIEYNSFGFSSSSGLAAREGPLKTAELSSARMLMCIQSIQALCGPLDSEGTADIASHQRFSQCSTNGTYFFSCRQKECSLASRVIVKGDDPCLCEELSFSLSSAQP